MGTFNGFFSFYPRGNHMKALFFYHHPNFTDEEIEDQRD